MLIKGNSYSLFILLLYNKINKQSPFIRVALEIMVMAKKIPFKIFSVILLFLVFLPCAIHILIGSKKDQKNKPNIIFITLDALRADHLGCYGYKRRVSENIDLFSRQCVQFNQTISQAPWTSASNCATITSLYPEHSLIELENFSLNKNNQNLIGILKKHGYKTALISGNDVFSTAFRDIECFFDTFDVSKRDASVITQSAVDWLVANKETPFFLWVYFLEPHGPYNAPFEYYKDFLKDCLVPGKDVPIAQNDGKMNEYYSFGFIPRYIAENGITDTAYYSAKYDGYIKFADAQLKKLFAFFKEKNMGNNTIIVLFSDHGESLTEHNFYFNHSHFVYDDLVKVPLIFSYPGGISPGTVINAQTGLIDLMPTILELLGIKADKPMEGKSLLPLLTGKTIIARNTTFSETSYWPWPRCIRTEKWKLIFSRFKKNYSLFNLKDDPGELNNLADKYPAVVRSLNKILSQWVKSARTYTLQEPKPGNNLNEKTKETLKELGYLQ